MITKKNIDSIILGCNSFERFEAFLDLAPSLQGKLYWHALRTAYDCSDNLYSWRYQVKEAFNSSQPDRDSLMLKRERRYLEKLPNIITVYRGCSVEERRNNTFGVSWSLKKETADFFAHQYIRNFSTKDKPREVIEKTIPKKDIIAFFNERKEYEVIYLH